MSAERARIERPVEALSIAAIAFNLAMVAYSFRGNWLWSTEDDVRQNLFMYARAQDGSLFPGDLIAAHAMAFQTPGYRLLMSALSGVVDVIVAAKLVAILVGLANVALFVWIARLLFRARSIPFWLTLVFATGNAYMWFLALPGMPRSVGMPLSLLALIAFIRPGRGLYVATAVLAALFSPTLLVFLGMLAPFKLLEDRLVVLRPQLALDWRRIVSFAIPLALCAGFVALTQRPVQEALGPTAVWAEWADDPSFQSGGRWPNESIRSLQVDLWILRERSIPLPNDRFRVVTFAGLLLLSAGAVVQRFRSRPGESDAMSGGPAGALRALAAFLLAGLIAWALAHAVALRLYFPDRYLVPAVPAVLFALAAAGTLTFRWLWSLPTPHQRGLRTATALGLLAFLAMAIPSGGLRGPGARPAMDVHLETPERELMTYLREQLPSDALVAGDPPTMDNVPLFARRSVLVNWEVSLPLYPRFYEEMVRRTHILIPAYFARDPDDLAPLEDEGVTHMVVRRSDLVETDRVWTGQFARGPFYMRPFSDELERRVLDKPSSDKWLWEQDAARSALLFANDWYLVYDLARLGPDAG